MHRPVPRRLTALAVVAVALLLAASGGESQPAPKKGGVLRVGMIGEPPTLDQPTTTAVITREISINIFETLFALDAKYQPVPLLVDKYEVQDGGKRYVFQLRKDVKFHNGKPMGSADVVASLKRWGAISGPGKSVFKNVEAVEAKGPNTVEMRLREPLGSLLTVLAQVDAAAVIYPKDVIDATGDGQLKQFIGTGPFKFVEHKPDRHIKLVRFDEYVPRAEPPNGLGGRKVAYVDEIDFIPVPDIATRQAGVQTGEYSFAQQMKPDQYERIKSTPGVEAVVDKPYGWDVVVFNLKQGLMTNKKLRQAVQAALDLEPAMLAGMGDKDFYRLDPGLLFVEQAYHSKAGAALFNQHDKAKAKRLMAEAGYHGQPIRWMVTSEYEHHYKPALVAKAQLEEIGFKIDLQVSDWATVVQRRSKPDLYDAFSTAFVFTPEPSTSAQVLCDWPGWWCNPEKDQLLQQMARESDFKKRLAMWDKVQEIFYDDAARIKLGDYYRLDAKRKEVQGFAPGPYMHFWNVWLDKK